MIYFDLVLRGTLSDDADGALQPEAGTEAYTVSENLSETLSNDSDITEAETLVPSEDSSSGTYDNAMLVLSVLQLFVLLVIALFTIVRRTNND